MPELPELNHILHSGMLSYGRYTREFEELLRDYFGTPYLLVTNSFSSAISVVITSLELTFGDEIILSPMSCLVSSQPYLTCGLKTKWCDVEPRRGTLSPEALRRTITSKTKAIVHNHYCGYPGYIDEINAIGREFGIPVIDDGIECFGSRYKGKLVGNCGSDVTVFSLGAVRIPNCIDGGIIIFKEKSNFERSILIRDSGIDRSKFRDSLGEINPDCDIKLMGYSATMSDVNGYIGKEQMMHVRDLLIKQKYNASVWDTYFEDNNSYVHVNDIDIDPNYWIYGILAEDKINAIKLFRDKGLYASGVHINNNIYSVFGGNNDSLPGVKSFYESFVALPSGWWYTNKIIDTNEQENKYI